MSSYRHPSASEVCAGMSRRVRTILLGLVGLVVFVGLSLLLLLSHEPHYYVRAARLTPAQTTECLTQFHHQASDLANQLLNETRFSVTFTEDQVNAWLLQEARWKYRDRLPEGIEEPRVGLQDRRIAIGARVHRGAVSSIVSVELQPVVLGDTAVALHLYSARAGALPLPMFECRRLFRRATRRRLVEWGEHDGYTSLIFHLPKKQVDKGMKIRQIVVGPGVVHLHGVTGRRHPTTRPLSPR